MRLKYRAPRSGDLLWIVGAPYRIELAFRRSRTFPVNQATTTRRTQNMNNTEKKNLIKWNTILWIAAMVLPAFFNIAFASSKFPWPMILPLLLVGPMLVSNSMLTKAIGSATDDSA